MAFARPLPCPNNKMAPAGAKRLGELAPVLRGVVLVSALRVPGHVVDLVEAAARVGGNDALRPVAG